MSKLEQMTALCADILARNTYIAESERKKLYTELAGLVLDREIMELPYAVRNAPFLTASKIKAFDRCEFCYRKKYIEQMPDPTDGDKDYFTVGQAVDDYLTLGVEYFDTHYACVASRVSDVQEAIAEQEAKIALAQTDVKKDGTRSATGLKAEATARESITFLQALSNKTQLTQSMFDQIMRIVKEYQANQLFDQAPKKRVFFHVFAGFLIKVELDDYIQEENLVKDIKTTSNILNCDHNFAEMYKPQMAMYQWIVEENTFEKPKVQLEIVDKAASFSRSHCIEFLDATLQEARGGLIETIQKMRDAHDTDYFSAPSDQTVLFNCPYYGVEGHGRPTALIYY